MQSVAVVLGALFPLAALADANDSLLFEYTIRRQPLDPDSRAAVHVALTLEAQAFNDEATGWKISRVEVAQSYDDDGPDDVWVDDSPKVDTSDGLWWVRPGDSGTPEQSQFLLPPRVRGAALALTKGSDLAYSFEGHDCAVAQTIALSRLSALWNYTFERIDDASLVAEGEDEPVELPPDDHEPPSGH